MTCSTNDIKSHKHFNYFVEVRIRFYYYIMLAPAVLCSGFGQKLSITMAICSRD